jgi:hypothetical protein
LHHSTKHRDPIAYRYDVAVNLFIVSAATPVQRGAMAAATAATTANVPNEIKYEDLNGIESVSCTKRQPEEMSSGMKCNWNDSKLLVFLSADIGPYLYIFRSARAPTINPATATTTSLPIATLLTGRSC